MATQSDIADKYKRDKFNDPFILNSDLYIPKDFYTNLKLARFLAAKFPLYVQAIRRTVAHFITDIQFVGKSGDKDERDELKDFLINGLGIMDSAQQAGLEYFILGNAFIRFYAPFERILVDRRNGRYAEYNATIFPMDQMHFNLDRMTYTVPDPLAQGPVDQRPKVEFSFQDRKSRDTSKIKLRFIDPGQMTLNMNHISGSIQYIYRFEDFFKADVRQGTKIYQINETPKNMLNAIRKNEDFVFNPNSIFHMANNFISGVSYNGWGIPNILLNYQSIHELAVLRNINEAVGLDYMLPIRMLSPAVSGQGGGGDAALAINMGPWKASMEKLIQSKRKDPTALHIVPFPATYQELGGNGKALAPVELEKLKNDQLLDGVGVPAELMHMSLQTAQIPTAIRMFESTFSHLQRNLNNFVKWVSDRVLKFQDKQPIGIKLALPSVADDLEKRHIWLQLAAGGEVSRETAYKAFSIDSAVEEAQRRAEEDIEIQKIKQKIQEDFEREQTLGSVDKTIQAQMQAQQQAAPQGAVAPGAGGVQGSAPGGGVTPLDIMQQAEEQAMQLLQIEDNGERSKALRQIQASNPQLHALVKQKMEEMRAQGASQGRKMVGKQ